MSSASWRTPKFVDQHQVVLLVGTELLGEAVFGLCGFEFAGQRGGGAEKHAVPLQAGHPAQGDEQMGCPQAARMCFVNKISLV